MSWWKDVLVNLGSCPKVGFELEMLEGVWLSYHRLRPEHSTPPPQKITETEYFLYDHFFGPKANEVINYLLNPQWMVLLQIVQKFICLPRNAHYFMQFQSTLPLLQDPANYLYPEQHYSGSSPPTLRTILILYSHLRPGLPCGLSLLSFPTKNSVCNFLVSICTACNPHLTLLNFFFNPKDMSKNHESLQYVFFARPLFLSRPKV